MIIIEHQAELKLTKTLELLKPKPGIKRCLWLRFATMDTPPTAEALNELSRHISLQMNQFEDGQLFKLFNGDMVIIASGLPPSCQPWLHDMASRHLQQSLPETLVEFHELCINWGHLASLTEKTIEAKRQLARQQQQAQQAKEREALLNFSYAPHRLEQMKSLRDHRHGLSVMVVEDDPFSRQMVTRVLRKRYQVSTAENGKETLVNYVAKAPNIVFLDIELPDISGHDLLAKLLEIDPEAYIVMLSGNGDRENVMQAVQAGAKGFVAKPFSKERLIHYIERCPQPTASA